MLWLRGERCASLWSCSESLSRKTVHRSPKNLTSIFVKHGEIRMIWKRLMWESTSWKLCPSFWEVRGSSGVKWSSAVFAEDIMQQCTLCFWHRVVSAAMQHAAAWPSPVPVVRIAGAVLCSTAKAWVCTCWFSLPPASKWDVSCSTVASEQFHLKKLTRVLKGSKVGNVKDIYLTAANLLNWHIGKAGFLACAKKESN